MNEIARSDGVHEFTRAQIVVSLIFLTSIALQILVLSVYYIGIGIGYGFDEVGFAAKGILLPEGSLLSSLKAPPFIWWQTVSSMPLIYLVPYSLFIAVFTICGLMGRVSIRMKREVK